jgi:hypothetical protein
MRKLRPGALNRRVNRVKKNVPQSKETAGRQEHKNHITELGEEGRKVKMEERGKGGRRRKKEA